MQKLQGFLSANVLKIIALITMTIDHIGYIIYPSIVWLRVVGRVAYPLFAYFIAEGCRYTKNKTKYFCFMFALGALCQVFAYFFGGQTHLNILLTFSFSVLLIYCLQWVKKSLQNKNTKQSVLSILLFVFGVALTFFITGYLPTISNFGVDYGFFGIMIPVLVSIFDNRYLKLLFFFIGQVLLCVFGATMSIQWFCLFSCLLIFWYNGTRGKYKLKYLFYIYYPVHLAIIWLIAYFV